MQQLHVTDVVANSHGSTNPERKSEVRYVHVRRKMVLGRGKMSQHVTDLIDNRGGATAAYIMDGNKITFAMAYCSPKDNFCRQVGRMKAAYRLNSPKQIQILTDMTEKEFCEYIRNAVAQRDDEHGNYLL